MQLVAIAYENQDPMISNIIVMVLVLLVSEL